MELKYILFDMDGVILDSKASILDATEYTLAHYGRTLDPAVASRIIGPPLHIIYTEIFGFSEETAREAMNIYRTRYKDYSFRLARPFDGAVEMLEELEAHGKKIMLATARLTKVAEFMLEAIGVRDHFCYIGGLSEGDKTPENGMSPKANVIADVLEKNGIFDRECAVMIGDRIDDIDGGKANGLMTIGAAYGFGLPGELGSADFIADSPSAISRYIIENF